MHNFPKMKNLTNSQNSNLKTFHSNRLQSNFRRIKAYNIRKIAGQLIFSIILLIILQLSNSQFAYSQIPTLGWVKKAGGTGNEKGISIAIDASGNIYTTGFFTETVDFDPGPGVANLYAGGGKNVFITKTDASGNFIWVKQIGTGSNVMSGNAIHVDNFGNILVAGEFTGTADFDPGPGVANMTSHSSSKDIFIVKFDQNGNFLWTKQIGGNSVDVVTGLGTDGVGNIYFCGYFSGTVDFDPGIGIFNQTSNSWNSDIFVCKIDPSGNFGWARQIGSSDEDQALSIAVDFFGNVTTTGFFNGTADFDPGPNTFNLTATPGGSDVFVLRLDSWGEYIWARRLGGTSNDSGFSVTLDSGGNVYTTGIFCQTADFDPGPGVFNLTTISGVDIFISKLDAWGNFVWAKQIAIDAAGSSTSIVSDLSGNLYISGFFYSKADFDPGPGVFNLSSNDLSAFILKLDQNGNFVWAVKLSDVNNAGSASITSLKLDNSGNIFTTGHFNGAIDFDPCSQQLILSSNGLDDIFTLKLAQKSTCSNNTCITPGKPTNVTATATGASTASLDWSPGNPPGSAEVTYFWVVGTSPSVTYGNGVSQGTTTGLWAAAQGLAPWTTYYLRVYAKTSCNHTVSDYSTSSPFMTGNGSSCITPGKPTNLFATGVGLNSASLDWSPGIPSGSPDITYFWVVGTSPNVTYGNGVAQGTTTGLWAQANGLTPWTTYYLRVFSKTNCNHTVSEYATSIPFTIGSGGCITPGKPTNVTATATGASTASLDWSPGNPPGSAEVTYFWVVGTSPSVTYGNGVSQGTTTGLWAAAQGLAPWTTYYLRVYAKTSCNHSVSEYATSAPFMTGSGPGCITPGQPTNLIATGTGPNSASLDWSPGNPPGSAEVTYFWVVGTSPSVTYGNGASQGTTTGLWASANGLSPWTTYYLRVFSKTGCNNTFSAYATSAPFMTGSSGCITPGKPINLLAFSTGSNSASLDWSPGNPIGSAELTYFWVVGTSPSVTYGNGVTQGSTKGLWASAQGLAPWTTYYLRVFTKTSCNNTISDYATSAPFMTGTGGCTTPGKPKNVFASAAGANSASLDWSPGNPEGSASITYFWVVGTSPSVTYGNGVSQGTTTGLWAAAQGLAPWTTYYLRVYAKTSCNHTVSEYSTSAPFMTGSGTSCTTPGKPTNVTATATGSSSASLDWSPGNPPGSAEVTYFWVVGTSPSVTYGNGVSQGTTTGLWAAAQGLAPWTTYYLRVYAKTSCNHTVSEYSTSAPFSIGNNCTKPSLQASNIVFTEIGTQQLTLQWVNGNGSKRLVYINRYNSFTPPQDGTDPISNNKYISQGEQVVYNGTGNSVTVTGLTPNTQYWFRIYETNCNGINSAYNISVSNNNPSSQKTRTVVPYINSFVALKAVANKNGEEEYVPFYNNTDVYSSNPPIELYANGADDTRFRLNSGNASGFSFHFVDKSGNIVSDGVIATDPDGCGYLGQKENMANYAIQMPYTHPINLNGQVEAPFKLEILYDGGLIGISIPVMIYSAIGVLPVELKDFNGKWNKKDDVNELRWTTLAEIGNDYFELERSFDNKDFEKIATIKGSGNSTSQKDYLFTDQNIRNSGNYYYRLKQVDFNGKVQVFDPVSINISREGIVKTSLYPNPSSLFVTCSIETSGESNVRIDIYDAIGRNIYRSSETNQTFDRTYNQEIETALFGNGVFTVVFNVDGVLYKHRLIVID